MPHIHLPFIRLSGAAAFALLAVAAGPAAAQAAAPAEEKLPAPVAASPAEVGDATRQMLAMQAGAGGAARPIQGDVASLSYQRYLDSFKIPIPEKLSSTVGKPAAGR